MKALLAAFAVIIGSGLLLAGGGQPPVVQAGAYATDLSARSENQVHNASLCVGKINGKVIPAGATFSFNSTVGPWTRDRGYRRAPVSFGGQLVDAWGGGVCQTSTTLYNAALLAGLKIDERSPHHYAPNYVSPGRDAAVAFPNIDLRFTNNSGVPLTIRASAANGKLKVSLEGRLKSLPKVAVKQRQLANIMPQEISVGGPGDRFVRNPGKAGHEVETFRSIGGEWNLVSHDSYPVMHRIVDSRN